MKSKIQIIDNQEVIVTHITEKDFKKAISLIINRCDTIKDIFNETSWLFSPAEDISQLLVVTEKITHIKNKK